MAVVNRIIFSDFGFFFGWLPLGSFFFFGFGANLRLFFIYARYALAVAHSTRVTHAGILDSILYNSLREGLLVEPLKHVELGLGGRVGAVFTFAKVRITTHGCRVFAFFVKFEECFGVGIGITHAQVSGNFFNLTAINSEYFGSALDLFGIL